jgi:hypothetical protein
VERAFVRAFDRLAMAAETEFPDHVGEFAGFRFEIDFNPLDVMFSGVGVGNFFADFERNDKFLVSFDNIRAFDDRGVFF